MKGFIFDFNGTLFWDSAYHEQAWQIIAMEIRGREFTTEEMRRHLHGRMNPDIIGYLACGAIDPARMEALANKKESIYRNICLSLNGKLKLAEGVIELLDRLKEQKVPMTIATASERGNLDFYIRHFKLERWFNLDQIVFDDGSFPGKPAPDIFLRASERLNLTPAECVVFEDSFSGIRSAIAAGIGRIVYVNSGNQELEPELASHVCMSIGHFRDLILTDLF